MVERGERGFKPNLIMMLLWMDVTQKNMRTSSGQKPGLLENNNGNSRKGKLSVGGRTELQPLALSVLLFLQPLLPPSTSPATFLM